MSICTHLYPHFDSQLPPSHKSLTVGREMNFTPTAGCNACWMLSSERGGAESIGKPFYFRQLASLKGSNMNRCESVCTYNKERERESERGKSLSFRNLFLGTVL